MFGAVIGDIIGSTFEMENHRSLFFEFFRKNARFTDETVVIASISELLHSKKIEELTPNIISDHLRISACCYFNRGFGSMMQQWILSGINLPYNSYGNASLIRVIPIVKFSINNGFNYEKTLELVKNFTIVTHMNDEAVLYSEILTKILFQLFHLKKEKFIHSKEIISDILEEYKLVTFSIKEYQVKSTFDLTAQNTLLTCCQIILESISFDDVVRKSVFIGGDTDTICSISCSIAEIIYGIPKGYIQIINKYFNTFNYHLINDINLLY
jgi:ADP-ribosylglycohydrolase